MREELKQKFFKELKQRGSARTYFDMVRTSSLDAPAQYVGIYLIIASLELWFIEQNYFRRFYFRRRYSFRHIIKRLTTLQISELITDMYRAEGVSEEDLKKKTQKKLSPK